LIGLREIPYQERQFRLLINPGLFWPGDLSALNPRFEQEFGAGIQKSKYPGNFYTPGSSTAWITGTRLD